MQNAKLKLTNPGVRFGWWYQNACGSKCRGDAHRGKKILPRTIDRGSAVTTSIYTETFSKKVWGCGGLSLKVPHEKTRSPTKNSFPHKKLSSFSQFFFVDRVLGEGFDHGGAKILEGIDLQTLDGHFHVQVWLFGDLVQGRVTHVAE